MAASAPNTNTPDPRPTGDLEHLFRQKFAEAEVAPRASFWDQLDHELVVQQNEQVVQQNVTYRRRLVVHRWVAAACLLLALGFGSWAFLWQNGAAVGPELAMQLPAGSATSADASAGSAGAATSGFGAEHGSAASDAAAFPATASGSASDLLAGLDVPSGATESEVAALLRRGSATPAYTAQFGAGRSATGLYSAAPAEGGSLMDVYRQVTSSAGGVGADNSFFASLTGMQPRPAALRSGLGLSRPDTLKPSLLMAPQLPTSAPEVAAVPEPEQRESPKLWRRLRLGASYAVGSYNPNINFSHTDGRLRTDMVTNAVRNYYQDEAEDEYRRNLRAGVSQRAALVASYTLNDRWTLTSGAEVAQQRATSATTYGFIDGKQVGHEAADLFNRPAAYSPAPAQPRATSYRYRTAGIPVGVRYGSTKPGLSLYAKVGAAVSVLLGSRSELEGSPEATRTYTLKSAESPYRQVLTSVRGGTGVRYQPASAAWNVVIGPAAEAGLTTLNAHPNQRGARQSRPYSIGLEASMEFGTAKPQPIAAQ
ncbi:hypothetical protein [Hymenobacter glacieicola]|uniref:Outer membrane protein beta-barrel domain-containing protein n=1 Tax=Hymenobacter glacieicola TaxID=1562124 RepID=A0ABQ1WGW5_9BACT|nr:hypothetical protein [Hymenobacter glacieicola]GGG29059.1 hypothetical protein GCM10011378_02160 [Hymenobacter glacieicola]